MAFSGFGIVFLNAESILALCFFIFFGLILQNADSASEGLEETRQGVQEALASGMIDGQLDSLNKQQQADFQLAEILGGPHLKS